MKAQRCSRPAVFGDRIQLFLAIRAGDVERAGAILDARPELLEADEQWTAEEALAGGFPFAHRVTPLISLAWALPSVPAICAARVTITTAS